MCAPRLTYMSPGYLRACGPTWSEAHDVFPHAPTSSESEPDEDAAMWQDAWVTGESANVADARHLSHKVAAEAAPAKRRDMQSLAHRSPKSRSLGVLWEGTHVQNQSAGAAPHGARRFLEQTRVNSIGAFFILFYLSLSLSLCRCHSLGPTWRPSFRPMPHVCAPSSAVRNLAFR